MAGPPDFPQIVVELGLSAKPLDPLSGITWTDVSVYAQQFNFTRGKQFELARHDTGTGKVLVVNDDRRFDPTNTSSPYSPNLLLERRVRISAIWNSTTYRLFTGNITGYPQSFDSTTQRATAQLEFADAFEMFNNWKLQAYSDQVLNDNAVSWWKLTETLGSVAKDWADNNTGTYSGFTTNLTTGAGPFVGGETAVVFNGSSQYVSIGTPTNLELTGPVTLESWVYVTTAAAQPVISALDPYGLLLTNTNQVQFRYVDTGGTTRTYTSTNTFTSNAWHHILASFTGSAVSLYIDGVLDATQSTTGTPRTTNYNVRLGYDGTNYFHGRLSQPAIYNQPLAASQDAAHAATKTDVFAADQSGNMVNHILDAIGWPSADMDVDMGDSMLQSFTPTQTVLQLLQNIENSEQGGLFMSRDGKVTFRSRSSTLNPASKGTFSEGSSDFHYLDLIYAYDNAQLYNDVTISRTGGDNQRAVDSSSQSSYGLRSLSVTLDLVSNDLEANDAANYLVNRYSQPLLRFRQLDFDGRAGFLSSDSAGAEWPQLLGREIYQDAVTLKRTPPGGGPQIVSNSYVSQINHAWDTTATTPSMWKTQWQLLPTQTSTFWISDDATYSVADSTTIFGY